MDAFDSDVLIYAADPGHPLGVRVAALFPPEGDAEPTGVGSVLLLPEVLTHPIRNKDDDELLALRRLLSRLDLRPVDRRVAALSVEFGAEYGLKAADAVHLATAVYVGADRFITNNSRDFGPQVTEIDVTYPDQLPDPSA